MSNYLESKAIIKRYNIARIPFIAINTIEVNRTLNMIKEVAEELNLSVLVHTISKGIYDISTNKVLEEEYTLFGAMNYMRNEMKKRKGLTFILTEIPDLSSDNRDSREMLDLINLANDTSSVIMCITNNNIWPQLQRTGMLVNVSLPNEEEMYKIINDSISQYRNTIKIEWNDNKIHEAATILNGVTEIEAQNVIATLIAKKEILDSDLEELRNSKNRLFSEISGLEKIEVDSSISNVGGLEGLRKWLNEKKELLKIEKIEELKKKGLRSPRGILLVGVPGCGKSLSAKAISVSWNLPLYRLDFATVQGSYVGQSEQQLKDALTTAENMSPCILWIDEIEKGLSGINSSTGVESRMVGQFLFWLQECKKQVFVVATANDVSQLPSELLRRGRFDELFFVDLPTEDERRDILKLYMRKYLEVNFEGEVADKIVEITEGFTGADLESTVRDLAYRIIANDNFVLNEEVLITTFNNIIPLSKTNPEKINAIRDWGRERAVPASKNPIGLSLIEDKTSKIRQILI